MILNTSANRASTVGALTAIALLVPLLVSLDATPAGAIPQNTLWVDVDAGSDSNPGTETSPLKSIEAARDEVRALNDDMTSDIVVNIEPGDYYLDETLTFGAEDSGTNDHDVIYQATGDKGSVHVIGGTRIADEWSAAQQSDVTAHLPAASLDHVFKVQLPVGTDLDTLYVDGERAVAARTKNYEFDERFPAADGSSNDQFLRATGGGQYHIQYGSDLSQSAIDGLVYSKAQGYLNAQFVIWTGYATDGSDWYQETLPIGTISTAAKTLTAIKDPNKVEVNRTRYAHGAGFRYFLQNDLSFVDSPGEYYFNKSSRVLYYYPKSSQVDAGALDAEVVYPTMQEAIQFKGEDKANLADEPVASDQVRNIVLDGLTVEKTDFTNAYVFGWNGFNAGGMNKFPAEATGSSNPSYSESVDRVEYHVGSITMTNANNITVRNSHITNAGMNGIQLFRDNDSITIENNLFDYIGMVGIDIEGGYPGIGAFNGNHVITNNLIHDVGQLAGHQPGISLASTGHNTLSHLEIFNAPRRAILLTAGWMRAAADANFNPLEDMYTVDNDFSYIYTHNTQQDGGEDSAIFGWILLNKERVAQIYGDERDVPEDKYNRFEQILIDTPGANPSMHDKNTVLGMDFAMRAVGLRFTNIKATNTQSYTISARNWHDLDNVNYNLMNESENWTGVDTFDDSRMDYDNIGLRDDFPVEYAIEPVTEQEPTDVYFSEDFESDSIDMRNKWIGALGAPEQSTIYMSEGPFHGKKSLAIDPIDNPDGTLLTRPFSSQLNKIVTMQFFDKRLDMAYSDMEPKPGVGGSGGPLPNSFGRADDGVTQQAIGADGRASKDYFVVRSGDTTTVTEVPRGFGWHEFKWDYTSGTDVKMYIDDTLVATKPATSFDFVSMGDPTGRGGRAYFDELLIYGGAAAPEPGNVQQHFAIEKIEAENRNVSSGTQNLSGGTGTIVGHIDAGTWLKYTNVNFGAIGLTRLQTSLSSPNAGKQMEVRLDGLTGPVIGTIAIASTGSYATYATQSTEIIPTKGLHDVYIVPVGSGSGFAGFDWFTFDRAATSKIEAESRNATAGTQNLSGGSGTIVGHIDGGTWLKYTGVNFGTTGLTRFEANLSSPSTGKQLQIRLDGRTGPVIGTITITSTGSYATYTKQATSIVSTTGVHDVYIMPAGEGSGFAGLDWFTFTPPLLTPATSRIEAESRTVASGTQNLSGGTGTIVGNIDSGTSLKYSDVDFGATGLTQVQINLSSPSSGKQLEVRLGTVSGPVIGTVTIASTGSYSTYTTQSTPIVATTGVHDVFIRPVGSGSGFAGIDWFTFQ